MIGVGITSPIAAAASQPGRAASSGIRATAARASTVGCWKTSRGVSSSPARRARLTSWIDRMLSPPRVKKWSSMPTRGNARTSANRPQRICSCGVRGAR